MSKSESDDVGYCKPPKMHRFSSENQPRRRRRKASTSLAQQLFAGLAKAMDEKVSISSGGKTKRMTAAQVFVKRLVKQGVGGTATEQMKLMSLMAKLGAIDPQGVRDEIEKSVEEEHERALEELQNRNQDILAIVRATLHTAQHIMPSLKIISDGFLGAKSTCSCGSFDNYSEAGQAIQAVYDCADPDDLDFEALEGGGIQDGGWAPSSCYSPAAKGAQDNAACKTGQPTAATTPLDEDEAYTIGPPGGDLADGMIGND